MPNRTVRASAPALPKDNPDAALIAMVAKCLELERHMDKANDAYEAAEENRAPIETPGAVIKTEEDGKLRLFAGTSYGYPYNRSEIVALRALVTALGRGDVGLQSVQDGRTYVRGREILTAWAAWQKWIKEDNERTGLPAAEAAYKKAHREHEKALTEIIETRARTLEGVMAKVRACQIYILTAEGLDEAIAEDLRTYGNDDGVVALSVIRDVVSLCEGGAR